ncbi:hypothetical protein ACFL2Q_11255 [Thermodesulfobacteriota bacterium]
MKRVIGIILAVVVAVPLAISPAAAWDFSASGAFVWEYEYFSQGGTNGFFGPHNVNNDVTIPILTRPYNLNFWVKGNAIDSQVSGLDAAWSTQWMAIDTKIRINKAVRIEGNFYIGEWLNSNADGELVASEYFNSRFGGIQRSFSPLYVNWLTLKAKFPFGNVSVGKRPSRFGMGLFKSGDENSSSESCSLGVPYGPFRMGLSFYPARRGSESYTDFIDKTGNRDLQFEHSVLYQGCNFDMGYLMGHVIRHRGSEQEIPNTDTRDRTDLFWGAYFKYNNGHFFLNAEYINYGRLDRIYRFDSNNPGANLLTVDGRRYEDNEVEQWAVELGSFFGPTKVTGIYGRASGPDRRHPWQDNSGNWHSLFKDNRMRDITGNASTTLVFMPYSFLMVYSYGLGTEMVTQTGRGQVEGASVWGGRADYAVASNLNAFGTFFYATRPDKGYGWGYLYPDVSLDNGAVVYGGIDRAIGGRSGRAPAIPDDSLGWEVDLGVDWKLLEGYQITMTFAYWEPGNWFKYACLDKANPQWNNPTAHSWNNLWGTNPTKSIDPVYGCNILITGEF